MKKFPTESIARAYIAIEHTTWKALLSGYARIKGYERPLFFRSGTAVGTLRPE